MAKFEIKAPGRVVLTPAILSWLVGELPENYQRFRDFGQDLMDTQYKRCEPDPRWPDPTRSDFKGTEIYGIIWLDIFFNENRKI